MLYGLYVLLVVITMIGIYMATKHPVGTPPFLSGIAFVCIAIAIFIK